MRMKTIYLAALACFISGSAFATPIAYGLSATGSGSLGGVDFTNALIGIVFVGDDQNVQYWEPNYVNLQGVTEFVVQGVGGGTISNGYMYTNPMNSPAAVGIADADQGDATIMAVTDNRLASYQLGTMGPITTTSYTRSDVTFDTSAGEFQITSLGSATFSAVGEVSTVPLPASLPMFASGFLALGLMRFGLKRKIKA